MDNTGVTGEYLSSEGKKGDAVWGTRGRWTMLAGTIGTQPITIAMIDHPKNPGFPTYWHARGYGLFAANPLGQKVFSEGRETMNFTLEPGASATFRYRVLVLDGKAPADRIEREFTAFRRESRPDDHVGLIGAGNISDTHARAVSAIPGAAVAAVYAPTREHARAPRGAARRRRLRHARRVPDAPAAGHGGDRQSVGRCTPIRASRRRRRGLHVLVEKPIDVTTARADALIAEAARAGVTLGVIFQDRLKPDVERLKALVDDGRLGTPILATASVKWYRPPSYYADSRWRGTRALDGGGALINQGVHTVDLLLWLFGPVRRVYGRVATRSCTRSRSRTRRWPCSSSRTARSARSRRRRRRIPGTRGGSN